MKDSGNYTVNALSGGRMVVIPDDGTYVISGKDETGSLGTLCRLVDDELVPLLRIDPQSATPSLEEGDRILVKAKMIFRSRNEGKLICVTDTEIFEYEPTSNVNNPGITTDDPAPLMLTDPAEMIHSVVRNGSNIYIVLNGQRIFRLSSSDWNTLRAIEKNDFGGSTLFYDAEEGRVLAYKPVNAETKLYELIGNSPNDSPLMTGLTEPFAIGDGGMYYVVGNTIFHSKWDEKATAMYKQNGVTFTWLGFYNNRIYFLTSTNTLGSVDLDGENLISFPGLRGTPHHFTFIGGYIYYADHKNGSILFRVKIDGTREEQFAYDRP